MTENEGNKLIAEFMGADFKKVDYFLSGINTIEIIFKDHPSQLINGTGRTFSRLEDLRYHESFDWLMPVVEKIEEMNKSMDWGVHILDRGCVIKNITLTGNMKELKIQRFSMISKIEAVWLAVIEFIQWYNQLKVTENND